MLTLDNLILRQEGFSLRASWQARAGERLALIGPSGAGKSSLLSAIAGFYAPAAGRVLWQGQDLTAMPPGQRPLSILFQDQNLFPHLTLAQNTGLGLRPDLRLDRAGWDRAEAALERVGLGGMGTRKPSEISGGQASRAALARVLLRARPILLLDEPFAALGPALKSEMLTLLSELSAEHNTTVLMVTHEPRDALEFAPLTVLVAGGEAAAPMPSAALLADPPPELRAYLGSSSP